MNLEDKLQELREKYKTADITFREIIKRQARALLISQELHNSAEKPHIDPV